MDLPQVRNEVPPICDHPSMNGHTQSEIYDLAQTSGEIISTRIRQFNQYLGTKLDMLLEIAKSVETVIILGKTAILP